MGTLIYTDQKLVRLLRENVASRDKAINWLCTNRHLSLRVNAFVKANGGDNHDVREIINDTVLILVKNILTGKYNQAYKIEDYLLGIARHLWLHKFQEKIKHPTDPLPDYYFDPEGLQPDVILAGEDKKAAVEELLDMLGALCKKVLKMWAAGYSTREISEETKHSENYTRLQIHRCKRKMEETLEHHPGLLKRLRE